MTVLNHSNLFITVHRTSPVKVVARSLLITTGWEATATIRVEAASLRIIDARWDVYRSPGGKYNGGRFVEGLAGIEAYLGAGTDLRAIAESEGDIPYKLLSECIKGIIQAETYLFTERGFSDPEAFEASWRKNYAGSCHLFSNLDRVTTTWAEHAAARTCGGELLFTRGKTAIVTARDDGSIFAAASFNDSFHELALNLTVSGGVISCAEGNFLRSPDAVCRESSQAIPALVGLPLDGLTKKGIAAKIGGPNGCIHLVDIMAFAIDVIRAAIPTAGR